MLSLFQVSLSRKDAMSKTCTPSWRAIVSIALDLDSEHRSDAIRDLYRLADYQDAESSRLVPNAPYELEPSFSVTWGQAAAYEKDWPGA
jgi:hypothetical protein